MEIYIEKIIHMELFKNIKKEDISPMLACLQGHTKKYHKGEYIIYQDDIVKNIGIILRGRIDMVKEDVWGNKTTLVRLKEAQLFGETFACGSDPVSAVSFYAATDCEVMFIPFARVMHTCSNSCFFHNQIIENMVSIIAAKNRRLMNKAEILSKRTIREKILAYLSFQSQEQGKKYFEIPFGRLELAEYLCVDRSSLTRELNNMKADGLIDFDKNIFSILSSKL